MGILWCRLAKVFGQISALTRKKPMKPLFATLAIGAAYLLGLLLVNILQF